MGESGKWSYVTPMPEERMLFGVATDGKGIYICGGFPRPGGSPACSTLWKYSIEEDTYTELPPMNFGRMSFDLSFWNDSLYAFTNPSARSWEIFSIEKNTWEMIDPEPLFIYPDNECEIVKDVFYFFAYDFLGLQAYNPVNGSTWVLSTLDSHHTYFSTGQMSDQLFMFGGFQELGQSVVDSTKGFNITSRQWYKWSPMPTARYRSSCARVNDLFYVIGGIDETGKETGVVEAFCPFNDTWLSCPPLEQARTFHRAVNVGGSIYTFGGAKTDRTIFFKSAERFDPPLPDLLVNEPDVEILPGGPILNGETREIQVSISNEGDWPVRYAALECTVDGSLAHASEIPFLDVKESAVLTIPWTATTGTHQINITVDPDGTIQEQRNDNNMVVLSVEVLPDLPDLWINGSSISVEDEVYVDGDTVEVGVDVENRGWVPATGIEWRMTVDGDEASNGSLQRDIKPGETVRITTEWQCGQGDRVIGFAIACNGDEIGRFPNVSTRVVHIPMRPDLLFKDEPRVEPVNVTEGGELTLTFTILNIGEVPVSDATVYIMMKGELYRSVATGTLDPNGTKKCAIPIHAGSPGKTSLMVIIDPDDSIGEINEDNNMYLGEFRVIKSNSNNEENKTGMTFFLGSMAIMLFVLLLFFIINIMKKNVRQS